MPKYGSASLPLALVSRVRPEYDGGKLAPEPVNGVGLDLTQIHTMVIDHTHLFDVIPSWEFFRATAQEQIRLVRKHTYMLDGLKPVNISLLEKRLETRSPTKMWSRLTDDHDAIMFSVLYCLVGSVVPWPLIGRIRRSIISNLLNGRDKFLLTRKEFLAKCRKVFLSGQGALPKTPRCLEWFDEVVKRIPHKRDSPLWAEQVVTLCNKRSTGPPEDPRVLKKALTDFFSCVTQPDRNDDPKFLLDSGSAASVTAGRQTKQGKLAARRAITPAGYNLYSAAAVRIQKNLNPVGLSQCATVLITTSACFESSQKDSGKLKLIRQIAASEEEIPLYDLESGQIVGKATRLADKILHKSLHMAVSGYPDINRTTVCVLPEVGMKVRIPTCSSFYRSQVLSPASKIFLEVLKDVPELNAGLSRARPAWSFYRSFDQGSYRSLQAKHLLASDYTSSTDWIKRNVAGRIFDMLAKLTGLPKWYAGIARGLYLSDLVHTPKNVRRGALGPGPWSQETLITSGVMMGDPITKSILSVGSIIVSCYISKNDPSSRSSAVGDDFNSATVCGEAVLRKVAEAIGFKVSDNDTFTSRYWSHFTEFVFRIPRNRFESYATARFVRTHPCYADSVRPRLTLRAGKMGNAPGDPRIGRQKLVALEQTYVPIGSRSFDLIHFANIWQDISFGVRSAISYIPTIFGGMGKKAPRCYINSLKQDKYLAFYNVIADFSTSTPQMREMHPARELLRNAVQVNTDLYQSHMGEKTFVNLTNLINEVESRSDFSKYMVISAADQLRAGVNLSRRLYAENGYVVTSEKIAERLYIFSSLMKEIYGVQVLKSEALGWEPMVPEDIYDYPQDWSKLVDYETLTKEFCPYRAIYQKEVLSLLETSEITHPRVPCSVDIRAHESTGEESDLSEFAKYVRALKGHTDDVSSWMNIPRKIIDDDSMIKWIRKLQFEETGTDLKVISGDLELLKAPGKGISPTNLLSSLSQADLDQTKQWLESLKGKIEEKTKTPQDLVPSGESTANRTLVDSANVAGVLLRTFDGVHLTAAEEAMVRCYLMGNYPPWEEPIGGVTEYGPSLKRKVFASLATHLGVEYNA